MALGQSTQTRDIKWVSGKEGVNILSNAEVSRASGELSQPCQGSKTLSALCCVVSPGFSTRTHRAQTVCGVTGQQVSLRPTSPHATIAPRLKCKLTPHHFQLSALQFCFLKKKQTALSACGHFDSLNIHGQT